MTWHIVSDSSCDLHSLPEEPQMDFVTIPFNISIGSRAYIDDETMDPAAMLADNEHSPETACTACPSPQLYLEAFSRPGPVIAFTISAALSGSYNSACVARDMLLEEEPGKRIFVVDTKGTGPKTVLLIRKCRELIRQGASFEAVVAEMQKAVEQTNIIFALASYHNLIKAGRVNRLVGLMAGHLRLWGVGVGDEGGKIAMRGKAPGEKRMIRFLVDEIKKTGLAGRAIVICHCLNERAAQLLRTSLLDHFSDILVDILPTRGLDSFYAERHGLIVAY